MIEQIFFGIVGIALLVLTFKLVHKEKFPFALFVFISALASFLLSATFFQGLMKTGVISTVVSTLKLYGNRLDDFQTTITNMGNELSKHQTQIETQQMALANQEIKIQTAQTNITSQQENIANQYQQISSVQSDLAIAQTNLNVQAVKIQNVEFLVDNLFSKMVFEDISASDTNRFASIHQTNGTDVVFFLLKNAPIPGSFQGTIKGGGGLNIPQTMENPVQTTKNFLLWHLSGFDLKQTSFSFQYVKDTRETNLFQKLEVRDNIIFLDGKPIGLNSSIPTRW